PSADASRLVGPARPCDAALVALIDVSDVAYAHPGGDLLFSEVSLRARAGDPIAIVGANGAGKTTLLRVVTGELQPEAGSVRVDGSSILMQQSIDASSSGTTVRELLAHYSSPHVRRAARQLIDAEAALASDGSEDAGIHLATAIAEWGEVGGYEQ